MRTTIAILALALIVPLAGCKDNEVTFYVEHVKMQPEAPACVTSAGDDWARDGLVDLALAESMKSSYYVTNAAMVREEYDNLKAETNGIIVEGAEVYVLTASGAVIGGTEYYEFQNYIPPETSDILAAFTIPNSVIEALRSHYGCIGARERTPEEVQEAFDNGNFPPERLLSTDIESVYSVVRFLGHTQGGLEVETQEYSFLIDLCCNCMINWIPCSSECATFCEGVEDEYQPPCQWGVEGSGTNEYLDCRLLYGPPDGFNCNTCSSTL